MSKKLVNDFNLRIGMAIENSNKSYSSTYKCNQRVNTRNKDDIYYLTKGNITAHSSNGGSLMYNILAPEILGLERLGTDKLNHLVGVDHFRCVTDAEFHIISKIDALDLLRENDLWEYAFYNILVYWNISLIRELKLNQPTTKDTVIEFLKYIWNLNPAQRNTTSVYLHILSRTRISRSFIHKVINELQKDGLITVRRGILIECSLG